MRMTLFLLFFVSNYSFAEPLKVMGQRLETFKESRALDCSDDKVQNSSHALKFTLSCSYTCVGGPAQSSDLSEIFSPDAVGLTPGNGSGNDKVIWSSLNVGLKTWSEKSCLDHAAMSCKGISEVGEVSLASVRSGEWKIDSFPKCKESKVTISPFDTNSKAEKFYNITGNLIKKSAIPSSENYSFEVAGLSMELPLNSGDVTSCKRKILGAICFGDCIDMSNSKELVETLATPEPLGDDNLTICGDDLHSRLKNTKTSKQARKIICENYFWTTVMKGKFSVKTCAAVRGEVDCSSLETVD